MRESGERTGDHTEGSGGRRQTSLRSTKTTWEEIAGGDEKYELQDVQTNSPFPSESQQALFKRKLIQFAEVVKILARSQSQLKQTVLYYS